MRDCAGAGYSGLLLWLFGDFALNLSSAAAAAAVGGGDNLPVTSSVVACARDDAFGAGSRLPQPRRYNPKRAVALRRRLTSCSLSSRSSDRFQPSWAQPNLAPYANLDPSRTAPNGLSC